jgi:putative ABC transport system permease protein
MRYFDSVKRAGRSLKNAKGRTILTALAIAVGAFTLTLAIAAGTGARQYADRLIESNVDPQSVIVAKDDSLFGGDGPPAAGGGIREYSPEATQFRGLTFDSLTLDDVEQISQLDGVEAVDPSYIVQAQYFTFEEIDTRYTSDITVYDNTVLAEAAAGTLPPLGEQIGNQELVMPESFVEKLGKSPAEMIGKQVTIRVVQPPPTPDEATLQQAFAQGGTDAVEELLAPETRDVEFMIRAVSAASSTSFSASSALFISNTAARELSEFATTGTDQFQTYIAATVHVADDTDPETVKQALEDKGFVARTALDLQELLFTIVNIIQSIVIVFGVLALIASVFGIINTQYIAVLERTREIGLMKALGMRGRHVRRLFQLEAAWIGLLGGVIGSVFAFAVGSAINPWLSELINLGEDSSLLVFEMAPAIGLIVVLMLIAMLAGWFPARKAAKLDPIEALRTE